MLSNEIFGRSVSNRRSISCKINSNEVFTCATDYKSAVHNFTIIENKHELSCRLTYTSTYDIMFLIHHYDRDRMARGVASIVHCNA